MLRVSYEQAAKRVTADPDRSADASSRDLDFLRSTHEAFETLAADLPAADLEIDTEGRTPASVAEDLAEVVLA